MGFEAPHQVVSAQSAEERSKRTCRTHSRLLYHVSNFHGRAYRNVSAKKNRGDRGNYFPKFIATG